MGGSRRPGHDDPLAKTSAPHYPGTLGLNVLPGDTPGTIGLGSDAASQLSQAVVVAAAVPLRHDAKPRKLLECAALFFDPRQSPSFSRVFKEALAMGILVGPYRKMPPEIRAIYDPLQNAILLLPREFTSPSPATHLSTAHELFHAIQHKDLVLRGHTPDERRRLRDQHMLSMTEDEFVQYEAKREKAAEAFAWLCDTEVKDSLSRARGGRGWPSSFHAEVAQIRTGEYWRKNREHFERQARSRYRAAQQRHQANP